MQKYYYNKNTPATNPYVNLYKSSTAAHGAPQALADFRSGLPLDDSPIGPCLNKFFLEINDILSTTACPKFSRRINNYIDELCQKIIIMGLTNRDELEKFLEDFMGEVENIFGNADEISARTVFEVEAQVAEKIIGYIHSEEAPELALECIKAENMTHFFAATPEELAAVPLEKIRKYCAEDMKVNREYTACLEQAVRKISTSLLTTMKELTGPEFNDPAIYAKFAPENILAAEVATKDFILFNNEVEFTREDIAALMKNHKGIVFTGNPAIPDRIILKDRALIKDCPAHNLDR